MNKNEKTICNIKLPTNALSVKEILVGDEIFTMSDPTVRKVAKVIPGYGNGSLVHYTDGSSARMLGHGSVRLANVPGYNYHAGHSCGVV